MLNLKPDPQSGYVLNTDARQPGVLWNRFRGMRARTLSVAVDWSALEARARSPRQFLWKKWTVPNPCAADLLQLGAYVDILGRGLCDAYRQILSIISPQSSVQLVDYGMGADVVLTFREISMNIREPVWARTTFPVLNAGAVGIALDVGSTRWAVPGRSGWRERADPITLLLREAMLSMGFGYCRNPRSLTVHPHLQPGLSCMVVRSLPAMDRSFLQARMEVEAPLP